MLTSANAGSKIISKKFLDSAGPAGHPFKPFCKHLQRRCFGDVHLIFADVSINIPWKVLRWGKLKFGLGSIDCTSYWRKNCRKTKKRMLQDCQVFHKHTSNKNVMKANTTQNKFHV